MCIVLKDNSTTLSGKKSHEAKLDQRLRLASKTVTVLCEKMNHVFGPKNKKANLATISNNGVRQGQ